MKDKNSLLNKYLYIFPNCVVTKGYTRSTIVDLQFFNFKYIPNSLAEIISKYNSKTIASIYKNFPLEDHSTLDEYIDFLLDSKYAFISSEIIKFIPLNKMILNQEYFSNAIIEIGKNSTRELISTILMKLESLGIWYLKVIIYEEDNLPYFIKALYDKSLTHVELILTKRCFDKFYSILKDPRISCISIYNSDYTKSELYNNIKLNYKIESLDELPILCAQIKFSKFNFNINSYLDSLSGNSCLWGKICITDNGNVKRCIFSSISFGNIADSSFLKNEQFIQLGRINKNSIKKCQDCEYRMLCTDCRTYTTDNNTLFSPPKFCKYNPYKGKWEL